MADSKISALAALATSAIAAGDLIPIVDVSDTSMSGSGTNKVIDAGNVAVVDKANTFTANQFISGTLGVSGGVRFFDRLTMPNNTSIWILDTAGVERSAVRLNDSDDLHLGGGVTSDNYVALSPSGGAKMVVTGGGKAGIGTTTPSYKLDVSGDINASGSVRSNGTPLTSDGTLKDAPTPTKSALSKLAAVRGYEFTWSDKARQMGLPEGTQHGLIAQEVEQIFPDLVSEWEVETGEFVEGENGEQQPVKERIKCVDYARMVPILLEAVRELAGRVDALTSAAKA